ncbi:hypothetical protein LINPERPRIM_LOCUS24776 [Linum perenne]
MADNGRVHPECVNADNPYHECGVACLEKISQGITRKSKTKKKSDSGRGVKHGQHIKSMDGGRRVANPSCPKAANPFHECGKYCTNKPAAEVTDKDAGSFILGAPVSMIRKKKEALSHPNSPRANLASPKSDSIANSNKKVVESEETSRSTTSSRQQSYETDSRHQPFDNIQTNTHESVPASGIITFLFHMNTYSCSTIYALLVSIEQPDGPISPSKGSFTCFVSPNRSKEELKAPKEASSPKPDNVNHELIMKTMDFSFSGISHVSHDSDDDEVQSVISDSCISVGKYHVRATIASILSSIFLKYGDIAENCRLESVSMRAYYLECLCSVVQELQSLTIKQLTKSKVKELLAVLKDVESAGIDVEWLRDVLNELTLAVELNNQHQAAEAAKAECDHAVESMKKELEFQMEELAIKEQAVAEARSKVEEARGRLSQLESESSKLSESVSSTWSLVEKFHSKTLADDIL